ncbi:UNVERIFIED_CONTAM: sporulation protein YunB [Acetivibrio alkalicellulosi]
MKRRKTNLYHRLWYAKRKRKSLQGCMFIFITLLILTLFISYIDRQMRSSLMEFSEHRVKAIVNTTIGNVVKSSFPEDINYDEVISINKDEFNRINSIQTDIGKLNRLFSQVTLEIQNELSNLGDERIGVPSGVLLGNSIFAARGPKINIKIIPAGSVETDFKSEFTSAGINQTKHRIYLYVKTNVGIAVPFTERSTEITTSIPIAETVIVGDVPHYYLNIEGLGKLIE